MLRLRDDETFFDLTFRFPDVMTWAERLLSLSHVGRFLATRYRQIEGAKAASGSVPATATRASLFMMADLLLGWLAIRTFHWGWRDLGWDLTVEDALLSSTDAALFYLRQLMTWLMGAPAGLKLNAVLSQSLGKFFLYHIHLWRTFLQVTTPTRKGVKKEQLLVVSSCF